MPYFTVTAQTTADELRRRYRMLCKRYHPDKGGTDDVQAQVNIEYHHALRQLAETEAQKGNQFQHDSLIRQINTHLQNILAHMKQNESLYYSLYHELKMPLVQKIIPKPYHGIAFEVMKMLEKHFNK